MTARRLLLLLFLVILAARLCHSGVLWAEENLPLAAAVQLLKGKTLYREVWFDKPPLLAGACLLWGALTGWQLRAAGALHAWLSCWLAWRFARDLWGPREGMWAAGLLAFFLIFETPSAAIPLAADLLMVAPHLAAMYLAWRGNAFWCGVLCGVAFSMNVKALLVLAACAWWLRPRAWGLLGAGFAAANAIVGGWMWWHGSVMDYFEQVWRWGSNYASSTFVEQPYRNAILRTANWLGFHATLAIAAAWFWRREGQWRWLGWLCLSALAVAGGWRFFPRYFFQLLPVLILMAARGLELMGRRRSLALMFLLIPLIRFGPRYAQLALRDPAPWADVSMDEDSREAARLLRAMAAPADTLFVWGFRPELFAYTRMQAGTRFLECQPMTGVPADRHLTQSRSLDVDLGRQNRAELASTRPTFVLDGLGPYNPNLAIGKFADLGAWLSQYRVVAKTRGFVIYKLTASSSVPSVAKIDNGCGAASQAARGPQPRTGGLGGRCRPRACPTVGQRCIRIVPG